MNEPASDRLTGEPRLSVGKRLIKTRKSRGWTLGYVANQLRLPESTIDFLEADDYQHLPAEVYVKGYLRNYARLLRLPDEEVIQSYLQQRDSSPPSPESFGAPPLAARPVNARKSVKSNGQAPNVRGSSQAWARPTPHSTALYWLALALLVALLSSAWWWPDHDFPLSEWVSRIRSVVNASSSAPSTVTTDTEGTLLQSGSDAATNSPSEATVPPDGTTKSPESFSTENPRGADSVGDPDAAALTNTSGPNESDTLILRFDGDSWATVIDAEGKRLIHQTGVAGTSKTLKGKAPFNLTVGRVANLSIEFNGKPIVFPNAKNRATERFSVPLNSRE